MKPEIGLQRKWLKRTKWSALLLGIVLTIVGVFVMPLLIFIGCCLLLLSLYLFSVIIVQEPERWIIERFGRFVRVVRPGWHHKIPLIETVRAKPRVWKQPISLFLPKGEKESVIQLVDGPVIPQNPVAYAQVSDEHPEWPIYRVARWPDWVADVIETVVLRYLQTLRIREAIDEGMGLGNIFDRINQAPNITRRKQRRIRAQIRNLRKAVEADSSKKEIIQPIIEEMEEEANRLLDVARIQGEVVEDLERILAQAKQNGIFILSVYIDGFNLPKEVEAARQKPLIAKREAEAAIQEALTEAIKRAGPIIETAKQLQEAGLSKEEAMKEAIKLEVMETLANKGLWTAGLPQVVQQVLETSKPFLEAIALMLTKKQ